MNTTSSTLLARLRQPNDSAAWRRFVDLYTPLIFYWGRRAGLQQQDAADLVQDVLTLLVQKLPSFQYDGTRSFRGWLRTVTLNKFRDNRRRAAPPAVLADDGSLSDVPAPAGDEEFWETEYRQHLVRRAMELAQAEFPPAMWRAFQEYAVHGRFPEEVARELGLSIWTVYSAKSRIIQRLRLELSDLLD